MLVGACADEAQRPAVQPRPLAHQPPDLHLGQLRWHAAQGANAQRRWNLLEELLHAGYADRGQHRRDILVGVGNEGHHSLSVASRFSYSAADIRPVSAAPSTGRKRMSQPAP